MTIAFVPSRIANLEVFRDAEVEELHLLAQASPLHGLLEDPAWREASAIDFAYASGLVEGNTYSREDAIALLTAGTIAPGKSPQEAQMLLNLRDAHALILDNAHEIVQAGLAGYREIHTMLMRGILPGEQLGATRATRCEAPIGCIRCSSGLGLRDWKSPNTQSTQKAQPDEHP